jgi:hypothetical protein
MKIETPKLERALVEVESANGRVMELTRRLASIAHEIEIAKQDLLLLSSGKNPSHNPRGPTSGGLVGFLKQGVGQQQ